MSRPDPRLTDDVLGAAVADARSLTAHEAANFLHISPATLRAWEEEFGFPVSVSPGLPVPSYRITELLALQEALPGALSVTSAVQTARRTIGNIP